MRGERAARLSELVAAEGLDALIVEGAANLRYVTGYTGSSGLALVRADGSGDGCAPQGRIRGEDAAKFAADETEIGRTAVGGAG